MRVLGNHIAVIINERIEEQVGLIHIPEEAREADRSEGVAAMVGPECKEVTEGCYLLIKEYVGRRCTIDDQEYTIIDEDDVLVILDEPKAESEAA